MTQWVASLISQIRLFLMPFVDSGFGLIYDRELNLSWLKDANYAKTVGRSPSGGMTWYEAMSWVAGLSYCGVRGWRLPSAFNLDGSGPCIGDNCTDNELGRLLTTAKSVSALNFPDPFSTIYWTATEDSEEFAYGFKLAGLKQGKVEKAGDSSVNLFVFLAWPVHDGDVAAEIRKRLSTAVLRSIVLPEETHMTNTPSWRTSALGH